jgi:hypothetical protein
MAAHWHGLDVLDSLPDVEQAALDQGRYLLE